MFWGSTLSTLTTLLFRQPVKSYPARGLSIRGIAAFSLLMSQEAAITNTGNKVSCLFNFEIFTYNFALPRLVDFPP